MLNCWVCVALHSNSLHIRNARYLYFSHSLTHSLTHIQSQFTMKCQPIAIICFSICHFEYFICKMSTVACETTFRITLFSNNNNTLQQPLFMQKKTKKKDASFWFFIVLFFSFFKRSLYNLCSQKFDKLYVPEQ